MSCKTVVFGWIMLCILFFSPTADAILAPREVLVVANANVSRGVSLARYYMKRRKIPLSNLLILHTSSKEDISFSTYRNTILFPVKKTIESNSHIRCILLFYGIPLKIVPSPLTLSQQTEFNNLTLRLGLLRSRLSSLGDKSREALSLRKKIRKLVWKIKILRFSHDTGASVDSEISLVRAYPYPRGGWIPNPYFLFNQRRSLTYGKDKVVLVSRLDAPTPEIVKRLIDDAIYVEHKGLQGIGYFDCRGLFKKRKKSPLGAYVLYDMSILEAGKIVQKMGVLSKVIIDTSPSLFKPSSCPDAALYCGWYSPSKYVDAFTWERGAIGYHIASGECATLKDSSSHLWCPAMLEKGICATVGPISEPYVQAFPLPDIFFKTLTDGFWSLAECYFLSLPYLSWKMVLIGDPIYSPFKNKKKENPG